MLIRNQVKRNHKYNWWQERKKKNGDVYHIYIYMPLLLKQDTDMQIIVWKWRGRWQNKDLQILEAVGSYILKYLRDSLKKTTPNIEIASDG